MGKGERPELTAPPEIFYNEDEARKYTTNSRMMHIQSVLTQRALELLALPNDGTPKLLLDLGCGSGLSGEELTEAGHMWVGFDISSAMLDVAVEREVEGDMALLDFGQGLPVRPGQPAAPPPLLATSPFAACCSPSSAACLPSATALVLFNT